VGVTRCLWLQLGHPVPVGCKHGHLTFKVGGSLESETVNYGHSPAGLRPESDTMTRERSGKR
jgi:hypothetical protein